MISDAIALLHENHKFLPALSVGIGILAKLVEWKSPALRIREIKINTATAN
jgi:hypothetical protein